MHHPPHQLLRTTAASAVLSAALLLTGCSGSVDAAPTVASSAVAAPPLPTSVSPPVPSTVPTIPPVVAAPTTTVALPQPEGPRPSTGEVITRSGGKGKGVLEVENGTGDDAYVTVAAGRTVIRGFYVRGGTTARLRDLPDGTYDVYFAGGSGWNKTLRAFTANRKASRFDENFPFETTKTKYTEWTVTLQKVPDGNTSVSSLPDASIPR